VNGESLYSKAISWCTWQDVVRTFSENFEEFEEEIENVEIPSYPIPASLAMKDACA